jgi:hypothetical protein
MDYADVILPTENMNATVIKPGRLLWTSNEICLDVNMEETKWTYMNFRPHK